MKLSAKNYGKILLGYKYKRKHLWNGKHEREISKYQIVRYTTTNIFSFDLVFNFHFFFDERCKLQQSSMILTIKNETARERNSFYACFVVEFIALRVVCEFYYFFSFFSLFITTQKWIELTNTWFILNTQQCEQWTFLYIE